MIKFYGNDFSIPSNKVHFTLNILGLEYAYQQIKLTEKEQKQDWFLKINPAGRVPVIVDDGFVVFESGAIMRYLGDKADSDLYPRDRKERAVVDQWMDFGSFHVGQAMNRIVFNRLLAPRLGLSIDDQSLKDGLRFLDTFLPIIEMQLSSGPWMAGPGRSLADLNLLAILDPSEAGEIDLSSYLHLSKWRSLLKTEDFYTRCFPDYGHIVRNIG